MSKFNIGDKVLVADPAYLVTDDDAHGWVSPSTYGKVAEIISVYEEDSDGRVGVAYEVQVDAGLRQTISQRYLTLTPTVTTDYLEDGLYQDLNGDVVAVRDNKVIAVLEVNDSCDPDDHLAWYQDKSEFAVSRADLIRLVVPTETAPLPKDGFYADRDGDIVQVKGDKMRYVNPYDFDELDPDSDWEGDLEGSVTAYGPYTPLVKEGTAK